MLSYNKCWDTNQATYVTAVGDNQPPQFPLLKQMDKKKKWVQLIEGNDFQMVQ